MALLAKDNKVHLTLKVDNAITSVTLKEIAATGKGHVTIDLT